MNASRRGGERREFNLSQQDVSIVCSEEESKAKAGHGDDGVVLTIEN